MIEEKARLIITDPKALKNARIDLKGIDEKAIYIDDPYEAASGSHAIAIMTEWELYRDLDYDKIYKSMVKPAFIFDGRDIIDHKKLYEIGFNVYPIGKSPLTHFK